jgi:hypothetical protein
MSLEQRQMDTYLNVIGEDAVVILLIPWCGYSNRFVVKKGKR